MKHIWKILLFFIVFCTVQKVNAQVVPLGNGLPDYVAAACTNGDTVYALTRKYLNNNSKKDEIDTVSLYKWNGSAWTELITFRLYMKTGFERIKSMAFYKNEIYIGGDFDSIINLNNISDLIRFNGFGISNVFTSDVKHISSVLSMSTFQDKLIVSAISFSYLSTEVNIMSWDGVQWENIQNKLATNVNSFTGLTYEMCELDNKLYITNSYLNKKEGSDILTYRMAVWDGTSWDAVPGTSKPGDYYNNLTVYQGNLVVQHFPDINIEILHKGKWKLLENGFKNNLQNKATYDFISLKDKLWASGMYNNGIKLMLWDGFEWSPVVGKTDSALDFFTFAKSSNSVFVYGNMKEYNGKTINHIAKLSELAKLTGNVFHDFNKDCSKSKDETADNGSLINITPGSLSVVNTDSSGIYKFYVDSGIYNLSMVPKKYFEQTCPQGQNLIIEVKTDSTYTNHFATVPKYNVQDIRLTLTGSTGWRARQGFTESYTLCFENVGTTKASGKIALKLDSSFTNFSSTPSPKSYTFPFAEWEFDSLEIGGKRCITFKARLDSATLNDSVTLIAAFDGGDGWIDSSQNDNSDTLKQRVVAALDPNDKTSFPEGDITKETKELRYQIRFQNVGTDTAYRVTVIDTIDTNLPLTKVMMNSASHKYKLDIKNNVFKWTFDGIMLPDSNRNEPLSNGFINYTTQIKLGLAIGTEIKNTAYIYFDYQKPVITNTARSKMTEPVGIRKEKAILGNSLNIYPNPAANRVYLKNTGNVKKQAVVFNSIGQQIQTLVLQPQDITEWNTNHLPNGLYFIQADGEQTHKLLIQQ